MVTMMLEEKKTPVRRTERERDTVTISREVQGGA
jgi:hypothetical protein